MSDTQEDGFVPDVAGQLPQAGSRELMEAMDALLGQAGADPGRASGKRVREMLHTALKMIGDGADMGELKLVSASLKELRYALKVFRPYRQTRKISIFGSARTPVDHPDYLAAVDFARHMAQAGWMVITGAGDGIMRAGHHGADRAASFGVSISLPFETSANDIIQGDPKLIDFKYFFTRKLTFMWMSHAVALFPGGFGTQDEGFEALTLIQTGKAPLLPIVLIDPPGGDYWKHWDNYIRKSLLDKGWISPEDLNLYKVFDDPAAAHQHVLDFYRNYHSARFVRDTQVLRLNRPLTDRQLDELNAEFTPLIKEGQIKQGGPLKQERDELSQLPRLTFASTKRAYGLLRRMIDRINQMDIENAR
ncbi:MAG: LOG family protein [Planctomycetota bacterium]